MKRDVPTLLVAALAVVSGCTPETRWGHEAVFAPDLRAYVIARAEPPTLAPLLVVGRLDVTRRIVVVNPITGEKIRCREELGPALGVVTREAATALADDKSGVEVTLPVAMTMPTTWAGALLVPDVATTLMILPFGLRGLLSAPGADSHYADGKRALAAKRYPEAERLFERALARSRSRFGTKIGDGRGAERELLPRRPLRARWPAFGRGARLSARHRARRRPATRALTTTPSDASPASIPARLRPCRSQAPLTVDWPRPR